MAYDPKGDGRTSIHAAYGRYDDYQILGEHGDRPDRQRQLRCPHARPSASRIDRRLERSRPPSPGAGHAVSERGDLDDARSEGAVRDAHGCRASTARSGPTCRLSANFIHVRGRHQLGTIDYNPIVPSLGPGRRPNDVDGRRRHVCLGPAVHVLRRDLVSTALTVSLNAAIQRTRSVPRCPTRCRRPRTRQPTSRARSSPRATASAGTRPIPRACRSASIPAASRDRRLTISGTDSSCPACISSRWRVDVRLDRHGRLRPAVHAAGRRGSQRRRRRRRVSDRSARVAIRRIAGTQRRPQQRNDARAGRPSTCASASGSPSAAARRLEVIAEAFNLFNRSNFSEVNSIFGAGRIPNEPAARRAGTRHLWPVRTGAAAPPDSTRAAAFTSIPELAMNMTTTRHLEALRARFGASSPRACPHTSSAFTGLAIAPRRPISATGCARSLRHAIEHSPFHARRRAPSSSPTTSSSPGSRRFRR